ncbi:membrane protein [Candidatus Omnitrophus magneticus]|uniref:Membrane protein n=1 Tax=Candidatus Omnitrophus magneticus TaxID=1609969 RepID=A0A0F0CUM0_9BACT|nr:membrane protein [Candidatus Omnitrophus magneticus]
MVLNFFFNCLISTLHPSAHRAIFVILIFTTHYSLLTNHSNLLQFFYFIFHIIFFQFYISYFFLIRFSLSHSLL